MDSFLYLLLFVFGLCIGSFLNVLVWRLSDEKAPKFWEGRSICPKCKHQLSWKDNIPLLSYLTLRGKCRYCKSHISIKYPIVELLTAFCTVLLFLNPWALIACYAFIVIFFADLEYQIIPDEMIMVIILATFGLTRNLGEDLLTGVFAFLGFWLLYLITKGKGIGFGDVKLAFAMGFLLGFPAIIVGVWSGFVIGGIYAVFLLILHRRKIHETMALGPFLVIGTLIAALWSNEILATLWLNY